MKNSRYSYNDNLGKNSFSMSELNNRVLPANMVVYDIARANNPFDNYMPALDMIKNIKHFDVILFEDVVNGGYLTYPDIVLVEFQDINVTDGGYYFKKNKRIVSYKELVDEFYKRGLSLSINSIEEIYENQINGKVNISVKEIVKDNIVKLEKKYKSTV